MYLAQKTAIAPVLKALFTSAEFAGSTGAKLRTPPVIGEILQRRCGLGTLTGVFPNVKPSSYGLVSAR